MTTGIMQRFKGKIAATLIIMQSPVGQILQSVQANITAHSGGGQANAVPLTAMACFISTGAVLTDSVVLPAAVPGMEISVIVQNIVAASVAVFPNGTDTINAGGAGASVAAVKNAVTMFYCGVAGQWWTK
jgi:hypothetical protein